ncbi:Uncharacterised protein [Vibrio cholerae]|nr:Uncharacterised protein [Vibrio cholerae]
MRMLMENAAIMVKIEAKRCKIPHRTLRKAVTQPVAAPARMANPVATHGLIPATIAVAATAAPIGKLPSTLKSGKSSTRKVKYTPKATKPYNKPSSKAPKKAKADIHTPFCLQKLKYPNSLEYTLPTRG